LFLKPFRVRTVIIGVALVVGIIAGSVGFGPAIANTLTTQDLAPVSHYPTNENGQTYGSALYATSPDTEPDLIKAIGVDGIIGYVRAVDLNGPIPKAPEEALTMQRNAESVREIKLYDVNGKTVIGKFKIEDGKTQIYTAQPSN
jgi:hypothetical protein